MKTRRSKADEEQQKQGMPKADTRTAKIKHAKSKIKEKKNKFTKKRNNAFPESSE